MNHKFGFSGIGNFGVHVPNIRVINYRFGFIGVGNMGGALARAASRSTKQIIVCDHDAAKASALAHRIDCEFADSRTVVAESEYVFLGVKPQMMADMRDQKRARKAQGCDPGHHGGGFVHRNDPQDGGRRL